MRRIALLAVAAVAATSLLSVPAQADTGFTDVPDSHVFADEIAWLGGTGISTGYENGNGTARFAPSEPVLREQMAAFLYRLAGEPPVELPARSPFIDVREDHAFYRAIVWLASTGVTTGYRDPDGLRFRPSQPVLREQMAAFLHRLRTHQYVKPQVPAELDDIELFTDVATSHVFARDITWLAYVGITQGYDDVEGVSFRPSQPVLREQMAAFLHRYSRPVFGGSFRRVADFSWTVAMSGSGRRIVHGHQYKLEGDRWVQGLDVWDRDTGASEPILDVDGSPLLYADGAVLSADGQWLALGASNDRMITDDAADQDVDIYLIDLVSDERKRVTDTSTSRDSTPLDISADGRYLTFTSWASDVVGAPAAPGGRNIYRWDRVTGETILLSSAPRTPFMRDAYGGAISADGRRVLFTSGGPETPGLDSNDETDVYLWDDGVVRLISHLPDGKAPRGSSSAVRLSHDGRFVEFESSAAGLDPTDITDGTEHYIREVDSGELVRIGLPLHLVDDLSERLWIELLFSESPTYLALASDDVEWIPDYNGRSQIVVFDATNATAAAITRDAFGELDDGSAGGIGPSTGRPLVSTDGRYVLFSARNSTLVPDDGHASDSIISWDRFGVD